MSFSNGKHIVKEVDGVRCSLVEENISKERAEFLRKLLEHNGFEVKTEQSGEEGNLFTVGVTDMLFNPVVYVYELRLRTLDDKIVTPGYWLQLTPDGIEKGQPDYYWQLKKK